MYGAIDLGGTKIEACLFDANLQAMDKQRVATPRSNYADLLNTLVEQCNWLSKRAGIPDLPIGMGIPGLIERHTGLSITANLPAMGHPLQADLSSRLNRSIAVENDCKCFALSEAHSGAGRAYEVVFGLILGTGVGGGLCRRGELMSHHNGLSGEVGHFGLPSHLATQWKLPVLPCGCGRTGCYETLVSGPGMSRLCKHLTGVARDVPEIIRGRDAGDLELSQVYMKWLDLLCELIVTIQFVIDPDCIVLGGGLSRIEHLAQDLTESFPAHQLAGLTAPTIVCAEFGDSSGIRGAAMLARKNAQSKQG